MEFYLNRIFQSTERSKSIHISPDYHQPSMTAPKKLEEIFPFSIDKRDVAYKSKIERDPCKPSKDMVANPGPGHYNPSEPKNYMV